MIYLNTKISLHLINVLWCSTFEKKFNFRVTVVYSLRDAETIDDPI